MNYKEFLIEYAKKNGFKFTEIDENTYKMNSRDGLLKVQFRDNKTYLEGWGAIIECCNEFTIQELEQYLDNALNSKKIVFCLDKDFCFVQQHEIDIDTKITEEYFSGEVKYCLVCDFYNPSKLYEYKEEIKEIALPKIENPIDKLKEIFSERNIYYEVRKVYLGELDYGFEFLTLDGKATYLRISSIFPGYILRVERESKNMDFSVYKSITIDLRNEKLEDIDFLSYFDKI